MVSQHCKKEDYIVSRLAEFEQNLSFPFTNKGAEHRLYLEHVSVFCKESENISKKRRKIQVKAELERQPQW